ncbi:MAG: two-component regulator propeller domain-containing protein [Bacteroidales bacterium]
MIRRIIPSCISVVVCLLFSIACQRIDYDLEDPEQAGKMTLFTTEDNLPGNEVSDIQSDKDGNLWVSFPGFGTAMYDNTSWRSYSTVSSPLLSNTVSCLAETADGTMIFGTVSGLSILSASNIWSSYVEPVSGMEVTSIKVARNGWIWIGTSNQGYFIRKGTDYFKVYTLPYRKVNVIEEGLNNNIFLGTDNGIIRWDGTTYSYLSKTDGLPDNKVSALCFDSRSRLWVGTNGGRTVSWIDNGGIHPLNLLMGSDSVFVTDIKEDRKGNIWFATSREGLVMYDGVIPHFFSEFNGFPENIVNCIGEDDKGNLWFGLKSKGLVRYTLPVE